MKELLDKKVDGEYVENPEWIKVIVDAQGKILAGIRTDGSVYIAKLEGVDNALGDAIKRLEELIKETGDSIDEKVKVFSEVFSIIDDVEDRIEITTDADGKIIAYRREDGTRVEHSLEVEHLKLSGESGNELIQELKKLGFSAQTPVDWSDAEFVEIPIPSVCAVVNIETDKQAETKASDIKTYIQYWDKGGNYFRKPVVLNAQGSSSMNYQIKNQAIDIDDGSEIKFGNWLPMDSFHIKKYFIDVFRGQCIVGYWLTEQVYQTRPIGEQRPWSYLYANDSVDRGRGDLAEDFISGALAHPDGFPVKVFFNGKNAGIYAFNLKKDRSNYNCKKNNQNQIILDGVIGDKFWLANGDLKSPAVYNDISFKSGWDAFEIRNPKIDKDIDGNKYDGDNPKEPSDDFSATKEAVERLTTALSQVNSKEGNEEKRAEFEKYFNVPFLIDYHLISNVIYNSDGYRKNWIWCTWDGKIWTPTLYDLDTVFGASWDGTSCSANSVTAIIGNYGNVPTELLDKLYKKELNERYKELRDAKVFDADNITGLLKKWCDNVGFSNLKEDIEDIVVCNIDGKSVPYTPSYRDGTKTYPYAPNTGGFYNGITRVRNWLVAHIKHLDSYFNYNI